MLQSTFLVDIYGEFARICGRIELHALLFKVRPLTYGLL